MSYSQVRRFFRRIQAYQTRANRTQPPGPASGFNLESLEQRVLLDASGFIDMTDPDAWQVLPTQTPDQYVMFEHLRPGTATGGGVTDTFVALQTSNKSATTGVEEGYNTDHRPLTIDPVLTDVGNTTHSVLLDDLHPPLVTVGGQEYREF